MKVFISYKSQNRDFANHLRDTLHSYGHETWMDVHAIPPGAVWTDEIQKGLEWADVTVGVMTEIALRSENVKNEWNWTIAYRQKYGKRLILLRLEDCDVPMHYITLNWIDIASMGQEVGLNLLQKWLLNPNENIADPSHPSPVTHEPYQEYLETLYSELVDELDFLVLSVERMMDIPGRSTPEQVQTQPRMLRSFSMRRTKEETETTITSFEEGFKKYKGRLLLLGEPGAGKTITLLTTARDAVLQRIQNPSAPLPLIGRIATWNASQQTPLHEWLAEYSVLSSETIKREIDSGNTLLLLDGLDELSNEWFEEDENRQQRKLYPRLRFIDLLNRLPQKNQILITSRITDYEQIGEKLVLSGSVTLSSLTNEQIQDYLHSTESTKPLWDALKSQSELLDVARTPLLLSLFAFAFRDLPEETRNLKDLSRGSLRDAIFEQYITRRFIHEAERFQQRGDKTPFSIAHLKFRLGYLATIDAANQTYWDWRNSVMERDIDTTYTSSEFIDFAIALHLGTRTKEKEGFRFIHQLLRDFLIFQFCIPILEDVELDFKHRLHVIEAASKLNDARLVIPILKNLSHNDETVRHFARNALVAMREHTWKPLLDAVKNEKKDVRIQIISILPELNNHAARLTLIELLRDNEIGGYAYVELVKPSLNASEALIMQLRTDDNLLKARIIEVLGTIVAETVKYVIESTPNRRPNPIDILIELLANTSPAAGMRICDFAANALKKIGTPKALIAVRKWREENNITD